MTDAALALSLGLAAGVLSLASLRFPLVGWVAFGPLGVAAALCAPAWAAAAGAVGGALANSREIADRTMRVFGLLAAAISALVWSGAFYVLARALPEAPGWLAVGLPVTVALAHLPLRLVGAPRWHANPLAQAQERWLSVVHTGRLVGDLTPTALLALSGSVAAMLIVDWTPSPTTWGVATVSVAGIGGALAFGRASLKAAARRVQGAPTVRVAAVVANGAPPDGLINGTWPVESTAYRDVDATVARYAPHVRAAAAEGAEIVVLPEVGVVVDAASRPRWLEAVSRWAASERVAIVAPFFDASLPKNELAVVDAEGSLVARYEKQHPVAHLEGKREARTPPGPIPLTLRQQRIDLSTVLCVDLDYSDLIAPVRASGGILVVPANDWPIFDELHHRAAVWAAALTGVSVVRSTGWGISSAYDGAGRVLARQSSHLGPVVMTVDVPVAEPAG